MAGNIASAFKTMFEEAHRLTRLGNFAEADNLCFRLLQYPNLPLLYRAGCNLMICSGDDKPVEFAEEAVKWYDHMHQEVRDDPVDGPKHLRLLEQAQAALEFAKQRVAEQEETEASEEEADEEGEADEGDGTQAQEGGSAIEATQVQQVLPSSPGTSTVVGSSVFIQAGEALPKEKDTGSADDE